MEGGGKAFKSADPEIGISRVLECKVSEDIVSPTWGGYPFGDTQVRLSGACAETGLPPATVRPSVARLVWWSLERASVVLYILDQTVKISFFDMVLTVWWYM